jgi:hypothetical protein
VLSIDCPLKNQEKQEIQYFYDIHLKLEAQEFISADGEKTNL